MEPDTVGDVSSYALDLAQEEIDYFASEVGRSVGSALRHGQRVTRSSERAAPNGASPRLVRGVRAPEVPLSLVFPQLGHACTHACILSWGLPA